MDAGELSFITGPGKVVASLVIALGMEEVWAVLREFTFPVVSYASVVSCELIPSGESASSVGVCRKIRVRSRVAFKGSLPPQACSLASCSYARPLCMVKVLTRWSLFAAYLSVRLCN